MGLLDIFKSNEITIEVDGLPVPVDRTDYEENPKAVEALVRQNRLEYSEFLENIEPAPDYNTLTAAYERGEEVL